MAPRRPFVLSSEGFHEEIPVEDALDVGSIQINAAGTGINMGGKLLSDLGNGVLPNDALNKAQVEALVAAGGIFREAVLSRYQLVNGGSGGIAAAIALFFSAQPAVGDTIIFYDGTNTRTYTFVADQGSEVVGTDVSIESSAVTAMQRLVARMNADVGNTWWHGYYDTVGEHNSAGEIHVVQEGTPLDALSTSRTYGTWATPADVWVVPFSDGALTFPYEKGTPVAMPSADPGDGRFGFSRAEGSLINGEIHLALDLNAQFSWEGTANQWNQISGVGAIPDATSGSGGGVKGLATFDSDKGLQVISNAVAEVRLGADRGLEFHTDGGVGVKVADANELSVDANGLNVEGVPANFKVDGSATGNSVTAQNLTDVTDGGSADMLHTHTGSSVSLDHSDLGGIGPDDHHPRQHSMTSAFDHVATGLTPGAVLTATGSSTFGWQPLPDETKKIENTFNTAVDPTNNGDPVYFNGSNTVGKSRADTDDKARVVGLIRTGAGVAGSAVEMVSEGPCSNILGGGGVANTPYYLQAGGGIGIALPVGNSRVIQVGYAMNANDLFVLIKDYGKKAA